MPNLLLTEKCVRACPYCFAKAKMDSSKPDEILSWENLAYIADLFESSNEKNISLLGGEPTLHPDFVDFVLYLLHREFHVNIFTSGIVENSKLDTIGEYLSGSNPDRLSIVCNVNEPKLASEKETEKLHRFLSILGHLTTLGFNIFELDFKLEFIFQLVSQYGLRKNLRLGLAHPIPLSSNKCLDVKDLDKMAERLLSYVPLFNEYKIAPGFDCGFPLCIFTDEQLGILFKINRNGMNFGCGPALDIGPDMSVWPCFPLSDFHRKSIYDFNTIADIVNFYREIHDKVRNESAGIYEKCDECQLRERGLCAGGCISRTISEFKKEPRIRLEDVYL